MATDDTVHSVIMHVLAATALAHTIQHLTMLNDNTITSYCSNYTTNNLYSVPQQQLAGQQPIK